MSPPKTLSNLLPVDPFLLPFGLTDLWWRAGLGTWVKDTVGCLWATPFSIFQLLKQMITARYSFLNEDLKQKGKLSRHSQFVLCTWPFKPLKSETA